MARDGKAFWYKDGQIIEVGSRHIIDVCNNAEVFGLTKEYIKSIYDLYSEEWGSEGKAREEIMIQLMEDGWIRVRESIDREGSKWTLQFDDYKKRKKELQEIVSQLLFDREDMKNFDSLVLLQCDGNFYKMYDTWKTNTKPSDFLAEGMNKKKKMAKMVYSYDAFLKPKKEQMIVEMADIMSSDQQYGFLITVFSNDHNPPHAHIRKLTGETIAMILITDEAPKNEKDIQEYRTNSLKNDKKKIIAEWANKIDEDFGCTYWTTMKNFWKRFQASNMTKK